MSEDTPDAALAREAKELHRRYLIELIERFSICPWAKTARTEERMRTHVIVEREASEDDLRTVVEGWAADDSVDVAFVIAPLFDGGYEAFVRWSETLGPLSRDAFLSAAFHPSPPEPAGTIRFLRRTPHPTVQLVRRSRLEEIRAQDPPHYTDIFELDLRDIERGKPPAVTVAASVLAHNERLLNTESAPQIQAIIEGQAPPLKDE